MKRFLLLILTFLLVFSCKEKVEKARPLIEIYELSKWVESYESQPLDSTMIASLAEYEMDTTRVRFSEEYGLLINGGFNATTFDLKELPLIQNSQILGFDFKNDIIVVDSTVIQKTYPDTRFTKARQLAMTIDKKVILSFYERSGFSSYEIGKTIFFSGCNGSFLEEDILEYESYICLRQGPFSKNNWWNISPCLKQDTTFYNAFKRAGKIIAE